MLKVFVGRMKSKLLFMPFDLHEVMAFTTYSVLELNCPLECLYEVLVHQTIMLVFVFTLLVYVFTTFLSTYHIIVFRGYHHLSIFRVWNLYWDFLEAVQTAMVGCDLITWAIFSSFSTILMRFSHSRISSTHFAKRTINHCHHHCFLSSNTMFDLYLQFLIQVWLFNYHPNSPFKFWSNPITCIVGI